MRHDADVPDLSVERFRFVEFVYLIFHVVLVDIAVLVADEQRHGAVFLRERDIVDIQGFLKFRLPLGKINFRAVFKDENIFFPARDIKVAV